MRCACLVGMDVWKGFGSGEGREVGGMGERGGRGCGLGSRSIERRVVGFAFVVWALDDELVRVPT